MNHFIAIDLPGDLRGQIADQIPYDRPGVNWVSPEKLHLTLFFCGPLTDDQQTAVKETLQQMALPDTPFTCPIMGGGGFTDDRGNYRVLYLSIETTDPLAQLQAKIADAMNPLVPFDDHHDEFRPHITLGRPKAWGRGKCLVFISKLNTVKWLDLLMDHVALYQSIPGESGHSYRQVYRRSFALD
jgi:2'-5' RNA ligase